jgi:SAM-dependent methyltransferase
VTVDTTYGAHANPALLARIPLDARAILDVGCGAGALGAAFRRRNPSTRLIGIEPDATLADAARAHFDELLRLDIDTTPPPLAEGSLDAMIFGDVLEHLRDPWAVLKRDAALLSDDGVLLACVPNLEHWSFTARVLAGQWRYEEKGLFDRTHLRWFTRKGMQEALEQAGLVPLEVAPRIFDRERAEAFARQMAPALTAMGVAPDDWLRRSAPLQYVWRAARRRPAPMVVVARVLKPVGGVNDLRILEPLTALATRPGVMTLAGQNVEMPKLEPEVPRILVLHRRLLNSPDSPAYIRALRATGAVIVQEFDDDPAHWPTIAATQHLAFRGVHAVQTSTPVLRDLLSPFNETIGVFPNALAELPEPRNFRDKQRLTLFFGALNREADIAPFLPVLNAVLAESGDRLAIEVVHDRLSFEALETPHKRFTPTIEYAGYREILGRCELAFLPLADTRFNRMKSDLKAIEAGGHRLCCLASPVIYAESLRHNETGLIVATPEDFGRELRALLAEPAPALAMAEAARAWVAAERLLHRQVAPRLDWYRDLWARRAALDAMLLRRAPEVG